jgi:hypothetical protein
MAVSFTNEAETLALKNFLNVQAAEDITIKLYSNDKTPGHTDITSEYTEVTGGGYASTSLTAGSWSVSSGNPSQAQYPQITFTFNGATDSPSTVYGYYAVGDSTGKLLWADKFPNAPINIANNGDQIKVTITISLNNP